MRIFFVWICSVGLTLEVVVEDEINFHGICSVGFILEEVDADEINFFWHLQCGTHLRRGQCR